MSENKIKSSKNEVGYNSDSMDISAPDENIFNSHGNLNSNENNQIFLDTQEISGQDCWKVISAYFSQHGLVSQQIDSFNQFVTKNIQEIIDENKVIQKFCRGVLDTVIKERLLKRKELAKLLNKLYNKKFLNDLKQIAKEIAPILKEKEMDKKNMEFMEV